MTRTTCTSKILGREIGVRQPYARTDLNDENVIKVELKTVLVFRCALYHSGLSISAVSLLLQNKEMRRLSVLSLFSNYLPVLRTSISILPNIAKHVPCLTVTSSPTQSDDSRRVPRQGYRNTYLLRCHLTASRTISGTVFC